MNNEAPSVLYNVFRFVQRRAAWIVAVYALLMAPAIYFAIGVQQDNSIHRLIVKSDPDYIASREFEKVFGGGEYVVLLAETDDPFSVATLRQIDALEASLGKLDKVMPSSILTVYRRAKAGLPLDEAGAAALRSFASGTDLFRKQGLWGDHFLSIPLVLQIGSTSERGAVLGQIDTVVAGAKLGEEITLRKVGQPYVNAYLDADTRAQGLRSFPLFFLFVVVLNVALYRSLRALIAFIIALAASTALTVGFVGAIGGTLTIVSSLVPMTILITCTATLVYLHSRFVERPEGRTVDDHQIFALRNKFLACTASIFATAVGFAALAVSKIRPVREMGLWVAMGLLLTWIVVFTLFPALQKLLRTPTQHERKVAGQWFLHFCSFLPRWSYRYRFVLVPGSLLLCVAGGFALFGIPGVMPRMELETNAIEYINHDSPLYKDTKRLEQALGGLSMTEVWLAGDLGALSKPETLRALAHLEKGLAEVQSVGSVIGMASILRTLRYVSGKGSELPEDDEALERVADMLEGQIGKEPLLSRFTDGNSLRQTHISVLTKTMDDRGYQALQAAVRAKIAEVQKSDPVLAGFKVTITGLGPLEAKISAHLVPTLMESFWLTVVIIFGTFLVIFRNGAARLMAMIPSLFAILVMFIFMRIFGMSLNVATILIASTVLGTSENDQIHFFYHFTEGKKEGTTEEALRHTLMIAGKAIFFATLINAGGFFAFALADLPPIRQFGILAAVAFLLSMLADFTALPAALWMVFRERPDDAQKTK